MLLEIIKKTEDDGAVWFVTKINGATDKYFATEEMASRQIENIKAQKNAGGHTQEVVFSETI